MSTPPPAKQDPYTAYAAQMFGVAYEDVTFDQRREAKKKMYLEMYGAEDVHETVTRKPD